MEKFVKFFYELEIQEEEDEGNIRCFLDFAEKYDIPHLKQKVERLAMRKLTMENMVDMFLLADFYSADDLKKLVEFFIKSNRLKVKEGLSELEKLEKSQLIKLLSIV